MDGFSSIQELYLRVKPALRCKIKDLKRIGVNYIQENDIWNYLRSNVWNKKTNLTLGEVVNDIMTLPNPIIEAYVKSLLQKEKRDIINEDIL